VAYVENFREGVSFSGMWWSFVFGVRYLWRHNLTSYSSFPTNFLAKFVDILCMLFYTHSPYFMCHCTEYKLSTLQVRISEENKLNATTQQFITAKISGWALKQGSKTHSSPRQSNLQLHLVVYEQSSIKSVRLDWLAHTPVSSEISDVDDDVWRRRKSQLFCFSV